NRLLQERSVFPPRSLLCSASLLLALAAYPQSPSGSATHTPAVGQPPPVQLTAEQDHQRILDLLHIASLRPGPDGGPKSPNSANYDEAKVHQELHLPDPLVLEDGERVTTASVWWRQRRPEIAELFDREIYGRAPQQAPKVTWEVVSSAKEMNGE